MKTTSISFADRVKNAQEMISRLEDPSLLPTIRKILSARQDLGGENYLDFDTVLTTLVMLLKEGIEGSNQSNYKHAIDVVSNRLHSCITNDISLVAQGEVTHTEVAQLFKAVATKYLDTELAESLSLLNKTSGEVLERTTDTLQ